MKLPGLCSGIEFHLKRIVVRPGDMEPSRNIQEIPSTIGFALIAFCFVFRGIPGHRYPAAFGIERNGSESAIGSGAEIAFFGSGHAPDPVFSDDGNPVPRRIDRGGDGAEGLQVKNQADFFECFRDEKIRALIEGKTIKKIIVVPKKLVNIVVG